MLVVDDSPEDAEVVRRYLRRAPDRPYVVRHVQLAGEALAAIRDAPDRPDVVLLDHGLPDMSGLELLELLAAEPGGAAVPVVMLTGTHTQVDTAVAAMQRGALDYLPKDALSPDALRRAIDGAVERFATARLLAAQRDELERRHQALDAASARTSRLLAIVTALGAALTPNDVGAATLDQVMPAVGATVGVVMLVRDAAPESAAGDRWLDLVCSVGLPPATRDAWAHVRLAPDPAPEAEVPLTAAMRTGEPVWLASAAEAVARFAAAAGVRAAVAFEAGATLPLLVDGRALGLLSLGFPAARAFAPDDQAFLLTVARQCAQALERARLYAAEHEARAEAEAARAQAEAANQAKSEFLAVMSHELRTPLNAIGGYAELMELGIRGPVTPEQQADLARIQQSQRHLLGLINGVLNYARVEAGAVHYDVADVPLAEVLATCEALVAPQMRAKGLALAHAGACAGGPDGTPLRVRADRDKVQQVVLNLLSNAVKFTPAGGRVELRCAAAAEPGGRLAVRVEVADTGIGIPPEKLASVFEPFVQVDARLTRTQEGTGLGLAISRDLARGMGGDLTAESTPGQGSTFSLTLPAA